MGLQSRHSWRRRGDSTRRGERGTALIEAAFVTPLFFLLIFGILEFGFLFRNYLTISNTTRAGSRTASVSGNDPAADYLTLRTIEHAFESWGIENVSFVVIYHATGPDDQVPAACLNGPVAGGGGLAGTCNYFRPVDFKLGLNDENGDPTPYFRCGPDAVDAAWCPGDRLTGLSDASPDPTYADGPAYIGVYVEAEHSYLTGFFGNTTTLSDDRIIRIEPDRP